MSYAPGGHGRRTQLTCPRFFVALAVLLGTWCPGPRSVRAQSCHDAPARVGDDQVARVSVSTLFARYAAQGVEGSYVGALVSASYLHPWVIATVTLPYYRLTRDGEVSRGLGDVATNLRVPLFRSSEDRIAVGAEFAMTFPSGDADHGLGMGHYMLMPGAWARLELDKLMLLAQAAYGRRVGGMSPPAHAHHHVMGPLPIVNPMNTSEIEHALSLAYAVHPKLNLQAREWGASPVATDGGVTREMVGFGAAAVLGNYDIGAEAQLPLAGSPFRYRTVLTLGGQW